MRWAHQLTSALVHIWNSHVGYYADLKLDNIIIRESGHGDFDVVLLDFEQRGAWFSWSPPEINTVAYLLYFVKAQPHLGIPNDVVNKHQKLLTTNDPP